MTQRQRLFCENYARNPNGAKAAVLAGYSEKTARQIASELLTKLDIRAYIDELSREIDSELIADAREIQATWTEVLRDITASQRDRLKAGELLAKARGMFRLEFEIETKREAEDVIIYLPELEPDENLEWHGDE